jgi:hypothetical protein
MYELPHDGGRSHAAPGVESAARRVYSNLVGVASRQRPELLRVNPGNPDASYLVHKLGGDPVSWANACRAAAALT